MARRVGHDDSSSNLSQSTASTDPQDGIRRSSRIRHSTHRQAVSYRYSYTNWPLSSRHREEDDEAMLCNLRRSHRTRRMTFNTFNTNIIQNECLGLGVLHDANHRKFSYPPPRSRQQRMSAATTSTTRTAPSRKRSHSILYPEESEEGESEQEDISTEDCWSPIKRRRHYQNPEVSKSRSRPSEERHRSSKSTAKLESSAEVGLEESVPPSLQASSPHTIASLADSGTVRPLRRSVRTHRRPARLLDSEDVEDEEEVKKEDMLEVVASFPKETARSSKGNNVTLSFPRVIIPLLPKDVAYNNSDDKEKVDDSSSSSTVSERNVECETVKEKEDMKEECAVETEAMQEPEDGRESSHEASINDSSTDSDAETEEDDEDVSTAPSGSEEDEDEPQPDEDEMAEKNERFYRHRRMSFNLPKVTSLVKPQHNKSRMNEEVSSTSRRPPSSSANCNSHEYPRYRKSLGGSQRPPMEEMALAYLRRGAEALPMNMRPEELRIRTDSVGVRPGASLADVDPMQIDRSTTFASIGGSDRQIQALKESVLLPLVYGDAFHKLGIQPPRGLLFHGPPGTGKTLLARALANECCLQGGRKVAFFMRKGADCLSKWVGESERQLRLLFDQAYRMRPSIIFFDEIDGLAPVRSSRQDQIHASIVSTLLGLIDGLDDRGEIIVIGATNRVDAIDPALRRPGRFDREFLFTLPDVSTREAILKIHCSKGELLKEKVSVELLKRVAEATHGYSGADLRAVVTEAALCGVRRRYPQIYHSKTKLRVDHEEVTVEWVDFAQALHLVQPSRLRTNPQLACPLPPSLKLLLLSQVDAILSHVKRLFPPLANLSSTEDSSSLQLLAHHPSVVATHMSAGAAVEGLADLILPQEEFPTKVSNSGTVLRNARLFIEGPLSKHIMPAVLHALDAISVHTISLSAVHRDSSISLEEGLLQLFREAQRGAPSVVYLPHVDRLWKGLPTTAQQCLVDHLEQMPPTSTMSSSWKCSTLFILATSSTTRSQGEEKNSFWSSLFLSTFQHDVCPPLPKPSEEDRDAFFSPLFLKYPFTQPLNMSQGALNTWLSTQLTPLPLSVEAGGEATTSSAPAGGARQSKVLSVEQQRLWEEDEEALREMRMCMRRVMAELVKDRRFHMFSVPVDREEVPDYYDVIPEPMDFSTIQENIDHRLYQTVTEFEKDLKLIHFNALEYNPMTDPKSRTIRHRAYEYQDCVMGLLRFLKPELRAECERIKVTRQSMQQQQTPSAAGQPEGTTSGPQNGATDLSMTSPQVMNVSENEGISLPQPSNSVEISSPNLKGISCNVMQELLNKCLEISRDWSPEKLETLHWKLGLLVFHYRHYLDKTPLLKEMEAMLLRQSTP